MFCTRNDTVIACIVTNLVAPGSIFWLPWKVTLEVPRAAVSGTAATVYVVDSRHSNARGVWQAMGSPASLSEDQVERLAERSALRPQAQQLQRADGGMLTLSLEVERQGAAVVFFPAAAPS